MNLSLNRPAYPILTILFLASLFPVFGQDGAAALPFSNAPYKIGERLTYIISYSNFSSAAHAQVQIVSRGKFYGRDAIQLQAHVATTELINVALIAINNDYTTYIDPQTGLPFRSEQVIRDAINSSQTSHEFTQGAGVSSPKQSTIPGTFDFLSVFYRLRSLPLADGGRYSLSVWTETEEYQIELRVTGKEVVRTNIGMFNTIATQVRVSSSSQTYKINARFSEDERHVPVLLTAKVRGGEIRAELAGSSFVEPPAPVATQPSTPTAPPVATPRPTVPETPHVENWPFTIGEELNYRIFLGDSNTPAGMATFQVRGRSRYFERDGLLLTVKAQTTGAVARVFVANDQINTYVDPKALLPYRTEVNLQEGKRRKNQTLTINQETGTATIGSGRIAIPIGTHDYLSFFYALRTFNLTPQRRNAISILIEDSPKTLAVISLKREMIGLGDQTLPAIPLTVTAPEDPQPDKYKLRIWVSDDRRRLPLRITANTELGPIRADLVILPTVSQ